MTIKPGTHIPGRYGLVYLVIKVTQTRVKVKRLRARDSGNWYDRAAIQRLLEGSR